MIKSSPSPVERKLEIEESEADKFIAPRRHF